MNAKTRPIVRVDCKCVVQVYLLIQLLYSSLGCSKPSVSCSQEVNSSRIEQSAVDLKQEQIETSVLQYESSNEISRIQDKCSRARQDLDRCSAQLMDMTQGNIHNLQEIDEVMCPKFKGIIECIKNNIDCYKPFERQIINWVLISTRRMNHKRCKNEGEKQKFLKLTQSCFATKNPMNKCMTTYVASLEAIANTNKFVERLSEDDIMIQLSCCANMRFKQCVMTNAKHSCKPVDRLVKLQRANSVTAQRVVHKYLQRSTFNMMEDLKQSLDSMALTGPEFICQSVNESFCQDKFDGRFQIRTPQHMSIVPAMISIYSNKS